MKKSKHLATKAIMSIATCMLLCPQVLVVAEVYQGYNPPTENNCEAEAENPSSSKESSSTKTSSSNASDSDWTKEGTTAYNNAKKVFMAFVSRGTSGAFAAGVVGWVNSEGGFEIVGRAQGHHGPGIENSIAKGAVPTTGGTSDTLGGGGIFQFDPYTRYAPLGSPDWEDPDKMVSYVIKEVARGDWNPLNDLTGKGHSFEQAVQLTDPKEASLTWNSFERGNPAYINNDQKRGDAQKAYEVFGGDKYKFDKAKFESSFGGNVSSNSDSDTGKKSGRKSKKSEVKTKVDNNKAIEWLSDRRGKVTYSQTNRTGATSYDCSSAIYYALTAAGADKTSGDWAVSTETEHEWLIANGYKKVYEGKWGDNKEIGQTKKGDIFIWGEKGKSSGNLGHTGVFKDENVILHCSLGNNGIEENEYAPYKKNVVDHGVVYIYRQEGADTETNTEDEDCVDSSTSKKTSRGGSGWSSEGGSVGNYTSYDAWKPEELPDELKQYAIDPKSVGMSYSDSKGWNLTPGKGGQCTDLIASLGYCLWEKNGEHPSQQAGNGQDIVGNWAAKFGGKSTTDKPTGGGVFSQTAAGAGNDAGHTGIVSHVFSNGDILVCEQNYYKKSGDTGVGKFTWSYRYIPKSEFKTLGFSFYDPAEAGYKIVSDAKALK